MDGAGIGSAAGSLAATLGGLDIPQEDARNYSNWIERGEYLVIIEGTDDEINRATSVLRNQNIRNWNIYEIDGARSDYPTGGYEDRTDIRPDDRPIAAAPDDQTTNLRRCVTDFVLTHPTNLLQH
ncbi:hypothetical protein BZZ01_10900 [Nostocales cyanobacterium HT-58-2]|nr:hypothetical protein BZZ01_10900 [Nostocales cyanobacterium HT-58-2]